MEPMTFKTSDFYYDLPEELIAQTPLQQRDSSRLMVLDRQTGEVAHKHFYDILDYLQPGDCLVMNDSRVLPARLLGHRPTGGAVEVLLLRDLGDKCYDILDYLQPGDCLVMNDSRVLPARLLGHRPTGGAVEVLLLRDLGDKCWECLCKPGRKMQPGSEVIFGDGELTATVREVREDGNRVVEFHYEGIFLEVLERLGKMPLPPYIKEELQDQERYQTVYSREVGSAAAPTAGLHFTQELLEKIRQKGVKEAFVTLHVGLGTFRPVKAEQITDHHMHAELCMISQETADILNETRRSGGRILCVGTTSCRTLESLVQENGSFAASSKWTEIFIYPGYTFKAMDGLITNFHTCRRAPW